MALFSATQQHIHIHGNGNGNFASPFHPSVWGDHFIAYTQEIKKIDAWSNQVEGLKEQVKKMVSNARGSIQELILIDELQRLGIAYHFEKENKEAFQRIYDEYNSNYCNHDLNVVALRFRLLRQEGYNVSSEVFLNFKDDQGNFKAILASDVRGLLSLYEAAYYGTDGEYVLDEAISFTKGLLSSIVSNLDDGPLATLVAHALELPMHKRMERQEARFYISVFQEENKLNSVLLELAKLDFNLLQSLHQKEIKELTRWWKELDLTTKYPFARDRLVEGYLWILGVYFEPQYARARSILTKIFKFASIIDDIFDVQGRLEDLEVFTDAIQRWDFKATDQLPDYLKPCYLALLKTIDEIEDELKPGEKYYRTKYLKHGLKAVAQSYLKEARWLSNGYVPTLEEYLKVSQVSTGYLALAGASFVGMGEEATKDVFDWLRTHPKFILDSALICRLIDDIQSNEFEQEREHVASAVECYMKEHGASRQETCDKFRKMVATAWKDMNEFFIKSTKLPLSLILRGINLSRVMEDLYLYEDGYTHSSTKTKEKVIAILVNPIPL